MNHEIIANFFVDLAAISKVVGNQFVAEVLVVLDLVGRGVVDLSTNLTRWQCSLIQRCVRSVIDILDRTRDDLNVWYLRVFTRTVWRN